MRARPRSRTTTNLKHPLSVSQDLTDTAKPLGQHWNPASASLIVILLRLGKSIGQGLGRGSASSPAQRL